MCFMWPSVIILLCFCMKSQHWEYFWVFSAKDHQAAQCHGCPEFSHTSLSAVVQDLLAHTSLENLSNKTSKPASLNLTFCLNCQELLPLCWASDANLVPESAGQDLCSQGKYITSEREVCSCTAGLLWLVWKPCQARLCLGLNMLFDSGVFLIH